MHGIFCSRRKNNTSLLVCLPICLGDLSQIRVSAYVNKLYTCIYGVPAIPKRLVTIQVTSKLKKPKIGQNVSVTPRFLNCTHTDWPNTYARSYTVMVFQKCRLILLFHMKVIINQIIWQLYLKYTQFLLFWGHLQDVLVPVWRSSSSEWKLKQTAKNWKYGAV